MSDLHTLMTEAAPDLTSTSEATVEADIARGRRTLRVRRSRRALGTSGIAAAFLVGGLAVANSTGYSSTAPQARTSAVDAGGVTLVAYHGKQPQGFLLKMVPSGWEVQASTSDRVILAPRGARKHDSTDWVGKLGVQLSLDVSPDLSESTLRIHGRPAVVKDGDGSTILYVKQEQGWLTIQAWKNLRWDAERLIQFGRGITVTNAAEGTAG